MSIKTGDKVIVISGKNKGKEGKIIKVLSKDEKVIIEGINMIKKHLKHNAQNQSGGIIEKEAPIHISNVKLVDKKANVKETKKEPKKETKKVSKKKAE